MGFVEKNIRRLFVKLNRGHFEKGVLGGHLRVPIIQLRENKSKRSGQHKWFRYSPSINIMLMKHEC